MFFSKNRMNCVGFFLVVMFLFTPIVHAVTNPLELFTKPDSWSDTHSYVEEFQLLGNSYKYTLSGVWSNEFFGPIPVVGKVIDNNGNVEIIQDENERLAVMLYAMMRYCDLNYHGRLSSPETWRAWAETMKMAAINTDPEQAKLGIHLLNTGTVLFGVGLTALTGVSNCTDNN